MNETNEAKKEKRRDYLREYARSWRKKNPDKNAAIQERYWLRKLQKMQIHDT